MMPLASGAAAVDDALTAPPLLGSLLRYGLPMSYCFQNPVGGVSITDPLSEPIGGV
jgi:hypothetical protein